MCGITGKINFDNSQNVSQVELNAMSDSIRDRGPDDAGLYINGNIGLGFRRLSIIDLNTGHQPLSNEDGTIWIVFNGEIYNYKELQEALIKQGHTFRTKSDTETIVHLYEQYGADCLKYLRGMFAFSIWDNNKRQLFCARDRFGIKPFYYYADHEKFVFGSEIKAILKSNQIDKTISNDALDSYFTFGYITSDLSIYKNITKLQPAHYLIFSKEKNFITTERYWDIDFEPDYSKSEVQWAQEIEASFSESVKLHMISDVPFGAFLSGGIDSSSVVAMMAKNSTRPIKTFSIGFKEQKFNELTFAREVAQRYHCEHHEQIVEPESISLLPKLANKFDEPFADSSAISTYYVSKLAREFVTVVLSGDGGDELFAGYSDYSKFYKLHSSRFNFHNPKLNKLIWGNIYKAIPQSISGKGLSYYLSQNKRYVGAYISFWTKDERQKLLLHDHFPVNYEKGSELYKERIIKESKTNDFVSNFQNLDMKTYMVDDILTKVDRASMLNSLEVRVPILDHKFAELTFKIPSNLKLKGTSKKYIFKEAMKQYLPESIFNHAKQGFGIPKSVWFKEDLKEYVYDTMLSTTASSPKYLNRGYIKKTLDNNKNGMRDLSSKVWSLIFFEEWLKQNQQV
jgi:asparagine synthase (glutamine-hydrolysing)